ncbi:MULTISPECIES: hypothetical protein [unclassified Streptomyces]|uniref:hypothetical protein n=1 Tax=unclassified Streptomyces TaxID=2593676 RepID=UPI00365C8C1F
MTDAYTRLATAASEWDELAPRLTPDDLHRLALRLRAWRTSTGAAARDAALGAARLLGELLPDRFPGGNRLVTTPDASAGEHLGFRAEDLAVLLLDGHRMVGPVLGEVRDRLLAAPSLGDEEVLRTGCDPNAPALIRLRATGGPTRLPSFQFTPDGRLRDTVRDVNLLLDADGDPWGAADWWLSPNAWLDAEPALLLGTADEPRLPETARLLTEGE